jgi:integrase
LTRFRVNGPAMSFEQYAKLLGACSGWLRDAVEFTFLTGVPPTCIERLEWSDVNLPARSYSILRKKGRKAQWRKIPMGMSEHTFALLCRLRQGASDGHVFKDECGRPLLADRISRGANEALRAAGVKGVTFYGLRHALASDMTAAGVATEVVRQAMGHQSIATTQKYANKLKLEVVTDALESVRGGNLVAAGE